MAKQIKDIAASVKAKLTDKARANGEDVEAMLVRFASERFLYRLSQSKHSEKFLLKGAALFSLWFNEPHRPTRDLDFLGFGSSDISILENIVKEVCAIDGNDGLRILTGTVTGERIREEEAYQGVRIEFFAMLGTARIPLRMDVGFGDAVTPNAEDAEFPTILDHPAPRIRVYSKETVVAEKFEAMVRFGMLNSRMKDFWDLRFMISEFEFDGTLLQKALASTMENRQTSFPERTPVALTLAFSGDSRVAGLWMGFLDRNRIDKFTDLAKVIAELHDFFAPIVTATNAGAIFNKRWTQGFGWK